MCKRIYPTKIQEENDKLVELYLASDVIDIDEFIEKNASQVYKDYMKKIIEEDKILSEHGVMA